MSERVQVILYTVVASAVLWFAVERFMGTTEEYASRLDIRDTPQDPIRDPEREVIDPSSAIDPASAVRAEVDPGAPIEGEPVRTNGEQERPTVAGAERADSDGDMVEEVVVVAGMSPEEAALLERLDPDLLRGRPSTRAIDLTLVGCTVRRAPVLGQPADDGDEVGAAARTLSDLSVAVRYRHGSVAIKGASLDRVDSLVDAFRRCDTALLVAERNPEGRVDVDDDARLLRRRDEELRYYLLQRRVPEDVMRFPESS